MTQEIHSQILRAIDAAVSVLQVEGFDAEYYTLKTEFQRISDALDAMVSLETFEDELNMFKFDDPVAHSFLVLVKARIKSILGKSEI